VCPCERAQQSDGLIERWHAVRSVYLELGQQSFQSIDGQFVADLYREAESAQQADWPTRSYSAIAASTAWRVMSFRAVVRRLGLRPGGG
jgi:hypothetical protein